jgi:hypothetical protein
VEDFEAFEASNVVVVDDRLIVDWSGTSPIAVEDAASSVESLANVEELEEEALVVDTLVVFATRWHNLQVYGESMAAVGDDVLPAVVHEAA